MLRLLGTAFRPIRLERMYVMHPCLFCVLMMVGFPLGTLLAVGLTAFAVTTPVAFLLGWI